MCNLYTVNVSAADIADAFKARMPTAFNAAQGDVYPGAPGMVVREADLAGSDRFIKQILRSKISGR